MGRALLYDMAMSEQDTHLTGTEEYIQLPSRRYRWIVRIRHLTHHRLQQTASKAEHAQSAVNFYSIIGI
jgi:hypothetical protein